MRDLSGLANIFGGNSLYVLPGQHQGLVKPGNIDLNSRPTVHNADGSISTVKSISFGIGNYEVLVPQVVGDQVVGPKQALQHYQTTGKHLGVFASPASANKYAEALHLEQAAKYANPQARVAKMLASPAVSRPGG